MWHILGLKNSLTTDSAKTVLLGKLDVMVDVFPFVTGFLAE